MPFTKYYLIVSLLLFFAIGSKAQNNGQSPTIITGRVYRTDTDTALANASIYYNGSTYGTSADKDGKFELVARSPKIPIIVSCVGYYSTSVHYEPGKPLIVYLSPKVQELQSVTVTAQRTERKNGMKRKDEVQIFLDEFIGSSDRAEHCKVINIDDVELFYDRKTETLTARCDKPIVVENPDLGYTISYFLDRFVKTPNKLSFAGNYIFRDNDQADMDLIKKNRATAYIGSRLQFIRSVWRHSLTQDGYRIFTPTYSQLAEENICTSDSLQQKYMLLTKSLYIVNSHIRLVVNTLSITENLIYIDKDGFYGPGLQWTGGMGRQRLADMLPYEYWPEEERKIASDPAQVVK